MPLAAAVLLVCVCVITTCSAVPHTRQSRNSNQATTLLQDANLRDKILEADFPAWWSGHMSLNTDQQEWTTSFIVYHINLYIEIKKKKHDPMPEEAVHASNSFFNKD